MWSRATALLREATKKVPAVRYALGVAGIMAALALGASFFQDVQTAVLGTLAMIVLMVLLLVFAAAAAAGAGPFRTLAMVMMWALTLLFIISTTLTVSAVFFDKPKPFPILIRQLSGDDPAPAGGTDSTERAFEVRAYALGDRVQTKTSETRQVKKPGDSVNVGCETDGGSRIVYDIPAGVNVVSHSAGWIDISNIKNHGASSERVGNQIVATGSLRGLDKRLLDCPGGGHATLELVVNIQEQSESRAPSAPIEIGSTEIQSHMTTFAPPGDKDWRTNGYRVDIRPSGSSEQFASIDLPGCGAGAREAQRTVFAQTFRVKCTETALYVEPARP